MQDIFLHFVSLVQLVWTLFMLVSCMVFFHTKNNIDNYDKFTATYLMWIGFLSTIWFVKVWFN